MAGLRVEGIISLLARKSVTFREEYESFEAAQKECVGYDADNILEKVKNAVMDVKNGNAAYERDSVLFYDKEINYNLMMYFYKIAYEVKRGIDILDWGGALGSTYFQHKEMIERDGIIRSWTVIEQEKFVEYGKEKLTDNFWEFRYIPTAKDAIAKYDCVLLSSVLQYIENYDEVIEWVCDTKPLYIILERTPTANREIITVERVYEPIYDASYATRILDRVKLPQMFEKRGYKLLDKWESLVDRGYRCKKEKIEFVSMVFQYVG